MAGYGSIFPDRMRSEYSGDDDRSFRLNVTDYSGERDQ
jgi:hypothetical protein